MEAPSVYIAGTGSLTAIGNDPKMNYFSLQAGINRYQSVDYFSKKRERLYMATVPDDALPPLIDSLDVRGKLSFRNDRILRMCHIAATQAMENYTGDKLIPLIYAMPASDIKLDEKFSPEFMSFLIQQTNLPIDLKKSRVIGTGRTGVIEALDLAIRFLTETDAEYILIGGGDSYQNTELLGALDKNDRLHAPGVMNGFAPGEAAGFILITNNIDKALSTSNHVLCLQTPGLADEPGHLYSKEPYKGDGLFLAFKSALSSCDHTKPVNKIFSSMNGENYWAKELGVATIRLKEFFDNSDVIHPADCYGDLGAATGAVLINLAVENMLSKKQDELNLIYCSSDSNYRAAVCLETKSIESESVSKSTNEINVN